MFYKKLRYSEDCLLTRKKSNRRQGSSSGIILENNDSIVSYELVHPCSSLLCLHGLVTPCCSNNVVLDLSNIKNFYAWCFSLPVIVNGLEVKGELKNIKFEDFLSLALVDAVGKAKSTEELRKILRCSEIAIGGRALLAEGCYIIKRGVAKIQCALDEGGDGEGEGGEGEGGEAAASVRIPSSSSTIVDSSLNAAPLTYVATLSVRVKKSKSKSKSKSSLSLLAIRRVKYGQTIAECKDGESMRFNVYLTSPEEGLLPVAVEVEECRNVLLKPVGLEDKSLAIVTFQTESYGDMMQGDGLELTLSLSHFEGRLPDDVGIPRSFPGPSYIVKTVTGSSYQDIGCGFVGLLGWATGISCPAWYEGGGEWLQGARELLTILKGSEANSFALVTCPGAPAPFREGHVWSSVSHSSLYPSYLYPSSSSSPIHDFLHTFHHCHESPFNLPQDVLDNYISSLAFYAVSSYILGLGDRHLGNILITPSGTVVNCDYDFIFGRDPKFTLPLRLSRELVDATGGRGSAGWKRFKEESLRMFMKLRQYPYAEAILHYTRLAVERIRGEKSTWHEYSANNEIIRGVAGRMMLHECDENAKRSWKKVVKQATNKDNFKTILVDVLHEVGQGIRELK